MKKIFLALALFPTALFSQVVVHDTTQSANMLKELQNAASMLQNAKNQLNQLQQTYQSMNGLTNMGNLVPSLRSNSNLPNDLSSLYNGSQTAAVRSKINQMSSALNGMSPNQAMQYLRQQEQIKAASDSVMTESIYNNQMRELQNMEQLTAAINSASTPKEIADLQARIQTAQGEIQAEQEKINLIKMAQDSQQKLLEMQKQQISRQSLYGDSDTTNHYPSPKITN